MYSEYLDSFIFALTQIAEAMGFDTSEFDAEAILKIQKSTFVALKNPHVGFVAVWFTMSLDRDDTLLHLLS